MIGPGRPLRILHLVVRVRPSSGPYNEHCLSVADRRRVAIGSVLEMEVTPPPSITAFEGDGTVRGFLRTLRRALDRWPCDVVHAHAPVTGISLIAVSLLRRPRMANAVFTLQNSFQNYRLRNRLFLYPIFALFPAIVVCSGAVLESLPRLLRWLGRGKVEVVHNAADLDGIDRALSEVPANGGDGKFRVISVARLIDIKNLFTLLSAFARHRDSSSRLTYVGEGHLMADLRGEAERFGLEEHVTFTGLLGRDEVYRRVRGSDVFVSTSRGEGLPVAVLEAMACACPVILSDIPPHRELAGDAEFIPLIAPDDVDGFGREIERFARMSARERADVGRRCRRLVEDRFGLKAMLQSCEQIYLRVMRGASPAEAAAVA